MKKLLFALLLILFGLVGCVTIEEDYEEKFELYSDELILKVDEGAYLPILIEGFNYANINLEFSNPNIVDYELNDLSVTAKLVGYTNLIITIEDTDYYASIDIYVEAKKLEAVELLTSTNFTNLDNNVKLYIVEPEKIDKQVISPLEFFDISLSDNSLASFVDNLIVPKKSGTLMITATHKYRPELTATTELTIMDSSFDRVFASSINDDYTVSPGDYSQLVIEGKTENLENLYFFDSINASVANVTDDGRVVGIKEGLARIAIRDKNSNKKNEIYIEVKGKENSVDYIDRIIELALEQSGYRQRYDGWTRFGEWYKLHYENLDWCAMFVAWAANQAGVPPTIVPRVAKVEFVRDFYMQRNRFFYKEDYIPVKGDIIIFLSDGAGHVALVTGYDYENDIVHTIEGNVSRSVDTRQHARFKSTITGYGHPDYSKLNS